MYEVTMFAFIPSALDRKGCKIQTTVSRSLNTEGSTYHDH